MTVKHYKANEPGVTAESFLGEIEDVLVNVGAFAWPWQPFRPPSDQELVERDRRYLIEQLATAFGTDDRNKKLRLLESLLAIGGFTLEDGCLEVENSEYFFDGNHTRVDKFGDINEFLDLFIKVIPDWDENNPRWSRLEDLLLTTLHVQPHVLSSLNLVDIRRYLRLLDKPQGNQQTLNNDGLTKPSPSDSAQKHTSISVASAYQLEQPAKQSQWIYQGTVWSIKFEGKGPRFLADSKGLRYYAKILAAWENLEPLSGSELCKGVVQSNNGHDYEESVYDKDSQASIRNKLKWLESEHAKARAEGLSKKATEFREEMDLLTKRLSADLDIKGKPRKLRRTIYEIDADSVRKALSRALEELERAELETLARHLKDSIKMNRGTFRYSPLYPIHWEISLPRT